VSEPLNLFGFVPGYEKQVVAPGKEALLLLFVGFLIGFILTRLYTRLGRTRGWGSGNMGGVHLHHVVPGVILVLLAGLLAFTPVGRQEAILEILAIVFGVGAALVLDEFALLFHMKDVYWSEEGRTSIDALIIGALLGAILLVSSAPSETNGGDAASPELGVFVGLAVNLLISIPCFLKSKPVLGLAGLFNPVISLTGAVRLAKPRSPWARWFYSPKEGAPKREHKLDRSRQRFENGRLGRFERWFSDLLGGTPCPGPPPAGEVATLQPPRPDARRH
jgi:lysyl-tRNA synthetase, class II